MTSKYSYALQTSGMLRPQMMSYASCDGCIWSTLLLRTRWHKVCAQLYSASLLKSVLSTAFAWIFTGANVCNALPGMMTLIAIKQKRNKNGGIDDRNFREILRIVWNFHLRIEVTCICRMSVYFFKNDMNSVWRLCSYKFLFVQSMYKNFKVTLMTYVQKNVARIEQPSKTKWATFLKSLNPNQVKNSSIQILKPVQPDYMLASRQMHLCFDHWRWILLNVYSVLLQCELASAGNHLFRRSHEGTPRHSEMSNTFLNSSLNTFSRSHSLADRCQYMS